MSREQAQAILLGIMGLRMCRPIKRAALSGYCYQHQPEQIREMLPNQPVLIGTAYLVKLALDGVPPAQWLSRLYEFTDGISDELEAALLRVGHVEGWIDRQAALRHIGKRGSDVEALAMALYGLRQFPDDLAAALHLYRNESRTVLPQTSCIVSAVSAARQGLKAISASPITESSLERLLALGERLAAQR